MKKLELTDTIFKSRDWDSFCEIQNKINEIIDWINETDHKLDKILNEDLELPEEPCDCLDDYCASVRNGEPKELPEEECTCNYQNITKKPGEIYALCNRCAEPKEKFLRDADEKLIIAVKIALNSKDVYMLKQLSKIFKHKAEVSRLADELLTSFQDPLGE